MRFCFIFRYLGMGGTETLMIRMSRWLIEHGHQVTVLSPESGSIQDSFPAETDWVISARLYNGALNKGRKQLQNLYEAISAVGDVDVLYCFSNDALWIAAGLINVSPRPMRCLAGVYVQRGYAIGPRVQGIPWLASLTFPAERLFQQHLPPTCRLYMNDAVKEYLERVNQVEVPGIIWPLPVDGAKYRAIERSPESGKIVSVGRLARMKEYNLWMIDVVAQLRSEGVDATWDVYGDGPLRPRMEEQIRSRQLESAIVLKGNVPYEKLGDAFRKAKVFVGMGTTLIEAGIAGVPAVVARAFASEATTYGYLHDLPGYTCGEPVDLPLRSVKDVVKATLCADNAQYDQIVNAGKRHAHRFDLDVLMPEFVKIVERSPSFEELWRPSYYYICSRMYDAVTRWYRSHFRRSA